MDLRPLLLSTLFLGLAACTPELAEQDFSPDKADVTQLSRTISGHVAFFNVDDELRGTPSLKTPIGWQDLYSYFGTRTSTVNFDDY